LGLYALIGTVLLLKFCDEEFYSAGEYAIINQEEGKPQYQAVPGWYVSPLTNSDDPATVAGLYR